MEIGSPDYGYKEREKMLLYSRFARVVVLFALLSFGCDSSPTPESTSELKRLEPEPAQAPRVAKAVEGPAPALPVKEEDMALVAEETARYEAEKVAAEDERDRDRDMIENEKISRRP